MVWKTLKVGNWVLKYCPIKEETTEYLDCDKDGNILTRVKGTYTKGFFLNEKTGEKHTTAFKLINGKPRAKLPLTKEVLKYVEIPFNEVEDLKYENLYLVECDNLYNELMETEMALKFGMTNGNGYKAYKSYLYPSKLYKGYLFLAQGNTQISKVVGELIQENQNKDKMEMVMKVVSGVNRAEVEELIQI